MSGKMINFSKSENDKRNEDLVHVAIAYAGQFHTKLTGMRFFCIIIIALVVQGVAGDLTELE